MTKIELASYSKPGIDLGVYEVKVEQSIAIIGKNVESPYAAVKKIAVTGDRYSLNALDIHMVYPAAGSKNNYANVLPHIILNQSMLPWLRKISKKQDKKSNCPWLALLTFYEDEKRQTT